MRMSRRAVIAGGAAGIGAGVAAGLGARAAGAAGAGFFQRAGLPLGLQLYTLGPDLAADLDGQLAQVAKAGYRTVELAGYVGRTPEALRAALDKAGLAAASSHVQAASSAAQGGLADPDRVIAEARVLGVRHIVLPMFPIPERIKPAAGEDRRAYLGRLGAEMTEADWRSTAALLNAKAPPLKAAGLSLAYHNHNVEFAPVAPKTGSGATGMAILLKETDPALVSFEMDAGWVVAAGQDPFAILKAHPRRFRQMHVKDVKASTKPNFAFQQDPTEVGGGIIDWKRLLPAARAAGVDGFFVEQEPPFAHPRIESARLCADYLLKLQA
ncbi:MAG: sugar phosphate isomerase/epimerase family protein [Phenylobacterium sp.]